MSSDTDQEAGAGVASAPRRFGVLAWLLLLMAVVSGVLLLLCIIFGFWRCGSQAGRLMRQQNRNKGRALVDQAMIIDHWSHPEATEEELSVITDLTGELGQQEYEWRFIGPGGTDGGGAPQDAFEQEVLERFLKAPREAEAQPEEPEFAERVLPDRHECQYYQPIRAKESCVKVCHRPPPGGTALDPAGSGRGPGGGVDSAGAPPAEGDLMAVAVITMPLGPVQQAVDHNRAVLVATTAVAVFLFVVFVASLAGLVFSVLAASPHSPGGGTSWGF